MATTGQTLRMRARLLRQLLVHDYLHPHAAPTASNNTTIRPFTYNASDLSSRPQLPFLTITAPNRRNGGNRQQRRYVMTLQRAKYEIGVGLKVTAYIWAAFALLTVASFAVHQEVSESFFPTPHEWSFITRMRKRASEAQYLRTDVYETPWISIVQLLAMVLARLEDPNIDGAGLKDAEGGPPGAKDITGMSEPWRRGYVEALIMCTKASEYCTDHVIDKSRNMAVPADQVKGPSNPFPKPIPPGAERAAREEDCVPSGFPEPADMYAKLLGTVGLTNKQRLDATLAYANWLEHEGQLVPAAAMYDDALNLAIGEISTPGAPPLVDPKTSVLNNRAERKPSENLLMSLTALATFKARHEDVAGALPILISILQARRSLPPPPTKEPASEDHDPFSLDPPKPKFSFNIIAKVKGILKPSVYPPPPPDGTAVPVRDGRELCQEAALHLHIGEVMYTMQSSTKEDGLAWTREGVDLAEQELDKVTDRGVALGGVPRQTDRVKARKVCRECLTTGLDNWQTMVSRMVKKEAEARKAKGQQPAPSSGWLGGLWSGSAVVQEVGGRWEAEERVVKERTQRAQELLEELQPPKRNMLTGWLVV